MPGSAASILDQFRQSVRGMVFRTAINRWTIPCLDRRFPAKSTGAEGERAAERYLRSLGWITLARNYLAAHGELDLVMVDLKKVVFVEVKSWRHHRDGQSPAEAVTEDKEKALGLAAMEYLQQHHLLRQACRFDVVAVWLDQKPARVRHYQSAFDPPVDW